MAHNIISGTVTNRQDHIPFRVTARKITKRALWIILGTFFAMLALGFAVNASTGDWTGQEQRQEQQQTPELPDRFTPKGKR
jgi:hypothetical protein